MHVHRDPNRTDRADDTASAISGGVDFDGQFSEWTVINNLFYDVDHACLNKGGAGSGAGRFIFQPDSAGVLHHGVWRVRTGVEPYRGHQQRLGECATFRPGGIRNGGPGVLCIQRNVQEDPKLQRIECRFVGRAIGFHHHAHSRERRR